MSELNIHRSVTVYIHVVQ